jgi:phage terminase small subunit
MASTKDPDTPSLQIIDGDKTPDKLTGKQLTYVQTILKGANQSDAYREAYNAENMSDQAIWTEAGRLFRHPEVSRRITAGRAAQERQALHTGASLRLHVEKQLFDLTTKADSDQAKLRALELLGKLEKVGAFTERVSVENDNRSADEIVVELEETLRKAFKQSA